MFHYLHKYLQNSCKTYGKHRKSMEGKISCALTVKLCTSVRLIKSDNTHSLTIFILREWSAIVILKFENVSKPTIPKPQIPSMTDYMS